MFTPLNWATPVTVYATARDDAADEPDLVAASVRHQVTSTDPRVRFQVDLATIVPPIPAAAGAVPADVQLQTRDNDAAAVVAAPSSALQAGASGGLAAVALRQSSLAADDVSFSFASPTLAVGRLSTNVLRFSPLT